MRTENLERTILKLLKGKEIYGYQVHKQLVSRGVKIEISRLYRVLTGMWRKGYLESRWEKSRMGPRKRMYRLNKKGKEGLKRILLEAIETVHGFYSEYLLSLPPKTSVFNSICRLLSTNLKGQGNIAYITPKYSVTHEKILYGLHSEVPEGKIYLVKPSSLAVDLDLDNLLFLDGTYDSIPLRDGYVDLLVAVGLPQKDFLETVLREWRRVLKESGTLAILTPTILIHKYEDPLTIGSFIEKYEHETLGRGEPVDRDFLEALLKNFFQNVKERRIVHITSFLASEPRSPEK
ncbi:MAG: helix-turn-helix transcriptional regulator [Candidatus Bathyarchaeia archaeon]